MVKELTDSEAAYLSGVFEKVGITINKDSRYEDKFRVWLNVGGSEEYREVIKHMIGDDGINPKYNPRPTRIKHCNADQPRQIFDASKCNRTYWARRELVYGLLRQLHFRTCSREGFRLKAIRILEGAEKW